MLSINDVTYSAHLTAAKRGLWNDPTKNASSVILHKLEQVTNELRRSRSAAKYTSEILDTTLRDHLAMIIIKTLDLAGALGYDMEEAISNKLDTALRDRLKENNEHSTTL